MLQPRLQFASILHTGRLAVRSPKLLSYKTRSPITVLTKSQLNRFENLLARAHEVSDQRIAQEGEEDYDEISGYYDFSVIISLTSSLLSSSGLQQREFLFTDN